MTNTEEVVIPDLGPELTKSVTNLMVAFDAEKYFTAAQEYLHKIDHHVYYDPNQDVWIIQSLNSVRQPGIAFRTPTMLEQAVAILSSYDTQREDIFKWEYIRKVYFELVESEE